MTRTQSTQTPPAALSQKIHSANTHEIGENCPKLAEIDENCQKLADNCRELMKSKEKLRKLIDSFNGLVKMVCSFKELAEIDEYWATLVKIGVGRKTEIWGKKKLFTCISSCRSRVLANMCIDMGKIKRL